MKVLLYALALVAVVAGYQEPTRFYHSNYGIAEAARIKQLEQALDFDGSRITGGSNANVGAHPHLGGLVISLSGGRQSVCGSSLLTNTRSVTAAHCWFDGVNQAQSFQIVWGSDRLFSGGTRVNTNNIVMHPNWNWNNLNNDVAVIVHNFVGFTNNINRILLASGNNAFAGQWATAAGYGRTSDTASITNTQAKRHVTVQVITNAVCRNTFGTIIVDSTICVATTGGNSPCPGDSGGPLAIGSGNNRQLIGIVSFGARAGCTRGFPAAFARVTSFNSWISGRL
uniref:Chymotrypsin-like serine protease n=1 Tax=Chilo infuscatellus TaxID=236790 RepID=A0A410KKC8_9NEOP|nr:chymotrypsin-like serine protease precursor [Chilo infuscatellus]